MKKQDSRCSFEILLNETSITLMPEGESDGVLAGYVKLVLDAPLQNIRAIDVRFVGGVVTTYKDPQTSQIIKGGNRLFDKQLCLLDTSLLKTDAPTTLDEPEYLFAFQLKVPKHMPPSMVTGSINIQYLVVAGLHYSYGCWGMFPGLAQDSIVSKHEVQVRRAPCLSLEFEEQFKQMDEKQLYLKAVTNDPADDVTIDQEYPPTSLIYLSWEPTETIEVVLGPVLEIPGGNYWVNVVSDLLLSHVQIEWQLLEHSRFAFNSNSKSSKVRVETIVKSEGKSDLFDERVSPITFKADAEIPIYHCRPDGQIITEDVTVIVNNGRRVS